MEKMILISPAGEIETFLLDGIRAGLEEKLRATCHVAGPVPIPEEAFSPERAQYLAPLFLRSIKTLKAPKNLLLTHVDLYLEDLNYVFGYAIPQEGIAIVSKARFRRDSSRLFERLLKTSIHEIGHLYGLKHCHDRRCVMHFSFDISDTDLKGSDFCIDCKNRLELVENQQNCYFRHQEVWS
jgi:archaemetzincin